MMFLNKVLEHDALGGTHLPPLLKLLLLMLLHLAALLQRRYDLLRVTEGLVDSQFLLHHKQLFLAICGCEASRLSRAII